MALSLTLPSALALALGVTLWLPPGSLAAQTVPEVYPSQVIVLADWGMSDVSEIGYLHVGVLHKREGDALAVYAVRHREPVVGWPLEPQRRTPPLDGDVFLLGHFDRGNTNRLGGYFNGFARAPSMSAVAITRAPDDGPALAYSYNKTAGSFAGFWIHLFDFKQPPAQRVLFDASPFTYLTFAIRGERGGGGGGGGRERESGAPHCRSRVGGARGIAANRGRCVFPRWWTRRDDMAARVGSPRRLASRIGHERIGQPRLPDERGGIGAGIP